MIASFIKKSLEFLTSFLRTGPDAKPLRGKMITDIIIAATILTIKSSRFFE
jgi:hypothetical protein